MGSSSTDADHRARIHRQEVVTDLSQQALETGDLDGLLGDATTAVAETLDVEYCAVFERHADGTDAVLRSGTGWPADRFGSATVSATRSALAGHAFDAADPIVVDDFDAETGFSTPELLADRGVASGVTVRIGPIEEPWGALGAYATERHAFTDADVDFLERVADVLGSAVESARTRRDLERTERRFEAVFEDPNILVGLLEPDGTVVDVNGTAMEYVDADRGDVTGEPFWETPWWGESDDVRDDVREWTERAAGGEYVNFEADLTRPDGTEYTLEGVFRPVTDDEGTVTSVIVSDRDVTEREERERRLSTLMDNVPGMVYRCENERGWPMEFVSDACEELTGYDPDALERGDVSWGEDVMVQRDRERLWETVQRRTDEGATFSETYRVETADGDRRWVRDYGRGVFDAAGELVGIEGIISDVTERVRTRRRLEEERDMFADGPAMVFRWRNEPGWPVEYVSENVADVLGYEPAELESGDVPYTDLLLEEEIDRIAGEVEANSDETTERFSHDPYRVRTSDGGVRWVKDTTKIVRDDDGEITHYLGYLVDITERKERERDLRRYETIVEAVNDGVYVVDDDGRFTMVNDAYAELVGYDREELLGEHVSLVVGEETRERARRMETAMREGTAGTPSIEAELETADGDRIPAAATFAMLPADDESGERVGVVRDVSDRKERERELRRKERRFEAIFEDPNILVGLLEPDGTVVDINGTAMEYIDADLADVTGEPFWETPWWGEGDDVQDDVKRWTERAADGEYVNFEADLTRPNGERYTLEGAFRPVTNDDGDVVSVIVSDRDVTERKERERQLEESEQRYRTLVDNFPNGAVALVDEELTYRTVGGSPTDTAGATVDEVEGEPVEEAVPPSLAEDLVPRYEAALEGEASAFEATIDDRVFDFQIVPVRDDDGEVFAALGMSQDVTERYEYERQLEDAKSRLEAATEAGAVGTWEWHVPDDRMVVSTTFAETFGIDPEAAREGVSLDRFVAAIHEDDRERVEREIEAALESRDEYEAEYRVRNADGEIRWVVARGRVECDERGDPVRFPGAVTDITERKRAQLQLERTNDQLETLFEILPVGVVVADADGRLIQANDTAEEIWGGDVFDTDSVAEYEKYRVWDADTGERIAPEEMTLARVLEGEEATDPDIYEIEAADGERRIIRVDGMPIRNDRGEVTRGVATLTDITERREYQRQLEESEQRYRTLVDNFPNGAVALFDEDLRYRIVGGTAFEELEDSSETVVGKHVRERYPPELADRMEANFEAALAGEASSFELEFHDRDWMAYTVPVRDDADDIFGGMVMVQDITERKERERKLRERERSLERYKEYTDEVLDAIDDLFYVIDDDGSLQRWNRSLAEVTGYTDAELETMDPPDFFGDDREAAVAAVERGFETGSVSVELDLRTKDGDAVPFEFVASTLEDPWGNTVLAGIGRDVSDRLERQRRLEESERRYRTLAQHFPNGAVGVYDRDLEYTLAEGKALGETLPPAERLEGDRMPEIFPEETVADLEPLFRAAVEDGETGSVQTEFSGRVWRVWATPLRDADGEIFAGLSFAQDITERVERESHLERYETIVEVVDDGVYVVDEEGRFTMVNESYAAMLGYEPAELVGEHVSLVIDEEIADRVTELESVASVDDAEWPTIEAELRTADGEAIPVEANFAMLPEDDGDWHRVGVARDISERKERERRLEESERRYRTLVENFPDGAVGLYDEDLEYIVVGGEAFDDLGIDEAEVAGATLYERYPDDLVDEIEPYFRAVFDGESNTFEFRAHDRDIWAHTLPVRNEEDEIFAGMVMVQDISERKEYERKLEESNERLERFAYAASHDLQEPLRMVTSYLTLLENRYADAFDEDGREFLEFAVDGADRMREMIDGLLEYSRVETRGDPFEPTDLNELVDDVLEDLQFRIEETDAEVAVDDLPRVEADASQLRQVFQNLLSNAITYSGDDPPRVRVDARQRGGKWVVSVEDEGIGIDPEDQERVFTIFDRLHSREEYDGTGIGLALCERIIERHGGEIWVDSEPGEGSTFSFTLPVSRD